MGSPTQEYHCHYCRCVVCCLCRTSAMGCRMTSIPTTRMVSTPPLRMMLHMLMTSMHPHRSAPGRHQAMRLATSEVFLFASRHPERRCACRSLSLLCRIGDASYRCHQLSSPCCSITVHITWHFPTMEDFIHSIFDRRRHMRRDNQPTRAQAKFWKFALGTIGDGS